MSLRSALLLAAAALHLAALPAAVQAEVDLTQLGLSRAQVEALNRQLTAPRVAPAVAFGSPVGFGAGWGRAFVGIGGQTIPPGSEHSVDGSATVGYGLLDPVRFVGVEVAATVISIYDQPGADGNLNYKLHRVLSPRSSVAVGVDNSSAWGAAQDADDSAYVAYTRVVELGSASASPWSLSVNVGAGNHRFVDPDDDSVGPFGSLALLPHAQISFVADWTGRDANAGVSVVPSRRWPVVLTVGAVNLAGRLERDVEFAGGIGVTFDW